MRAAHPSAKACANLERSACDRSTTELLEILLQRDVADVEHIHAIARLIDSAQIVAATEKPDALAGAWPNEARLAISSIATRTSKIFGGSSHNHPAGIL